jgi:hypothetical protein
MQPLRTAYQPGINQILINILDLDFLQPTYNTDKIFFALHLQQLAVPKAQIEKVLFCDVLEEFPISQ